MNAFLSPMHRFVRHTLKPDWPFKYTSFCCQSLIEGLLDARSNGSKHSLRPRGAYSLGGKIATVRETDKNICDYKLRKTW